MNDNPFADDNQHIPLADSDNPFADPAIDSALNSTDPVDDDARTLLKNAYEPPTSKSPLHGNPSPPSDDVSRREAELMRREAALLARETQLRDTLANPALHKPPNFPPFYPFMFHDIDIEIPELCRDIVRQLYYSWLALLGTLGWNAISAFLIMVSHAQDVITGSTDFGTALVYCFTITAASFFLWYRPVYNAFMKENSLYYYFYFVFNGFHIVFSYYMALGIPGSGSAGLINSISMLTDSKILAGVFGLVDTAAWAALATGSLWLYRQVHTHYRVQGHTFEAAKGEALRTVVAGGARPAASSMV